MRSIRISAFAFIAAIGCSDPQPRGGAPQAEPPGETDRTVPDRPAGDPLPHAVSRDAAPCPDAVLHVADGLEQGWLCPAQVIAHGLTIVDMSERWAPMPLSAGPDGKGPKYRDTYLALAAERDPDGGELPPEERLVEMYGITPAWSVVLRRLTDEQRHACHAAIDDAPLALITRKLEQAGNAEIDARQRQRTWMARHLEQQRKRRKLADRGGLVAFKSLRGMVTTWQRLEAEHAATKTMQQHLVCEGLLKKKWVDGRFIWLTADAVDFYQRSNFLLPDGSLDADTREALTAGSLELAFRGALRVLRERVADATGLIEDGSAGSGPQPVLGRPLEPAVMRLAKGHVPLPDAAPDLVGAATEAAARQLGWITPELARDFLARHKGDDLQIALALPAAPTYHSAHMDLRTVIDRGDVWYDERPRTHKPQRRPATILYALDGAVKRPLVRWPTTIGGWSDERLPSGRVKKKWKESDVGRRVWKDLYIAPTWQPPRTTPDKDLVKNLWNGRYRLKHEVLGPGPRSAYGMVMLVHHKPVKLGKNRIYWADNGIRSHGASSVTSVVRGTSHGCHRLLNHLAVRLASFLLRHRTHVRHGQEKDHYRRVVRSHGVYPIKINTRGYRYELTPPVPVEVTKGRIMSKRKKPPRR